MSLLPLHGKQWWPWPSWAASPSLVHLTGGPAFEPVEPKLFLSPSPHTPQSTALSTAQTAIFIHPLWWQSNTFITQTCCGLGGFVFIKGWTHHPPHLSEWLDIKTGSLHTLPVVWIHPGIYTHLICQSDRTGDRECLSHGAEGIP